MIFILFYFILFFFCFLFFKHFKFVKYLRRPPSENEEFRLDRLLKRKAEEGVMIYVVVYKEVKYSLALDSFHTKTTLQELHKNIRGIF